MSAVFLDTKSVERGDLDLDSLRQAYPDWTLYDYTDSAQTADRIRNAEIVVSNKVIIDERCFAQAKKLKLVCVAATGTNNIDLAAAKKHQITVCNVRAYATHSVVQHVFALILSLSRKLPEYTRLVDEGAWQKSPIFCLLDYPIQDLYGKTLGIIGYGELGKAVESVAKAFGLNTLIAQGSAPQGTASRVQLQTVLQNADIVTLHCPLTEETRGLIGEAELRLMKPEAILINAARGGIVDEAELVKALEDKQITGAGFDVLTKEPPDDNPLLRYKKPNLIITPHIAWASALARQTMLDEIAQNIRAFRQGAARNVV